MANHHLPPPITAVWIGVREAEPTAGYSHFAARARPGRLAPPPGAATDYSDPLNIKIATLVIGPVVFHVFSTALSGLEHWRLPSPSDQGLIELWPRLESVSWPPGTIRQRWAIEYTQRVLWYDPHFRWATEPLGAVTTHRSGHRASTVLG